MRVQGHFRRHSGVRVRAERAPAGADHVVWREPDRRRHMLFRPRTVFGHDECIRLLQFDCEKVRQHDRHEHSPRSALLGLAYDDDVLDAGGRCGALATRPLFLQDRPGCRNESEPAACAEDLDDLLHVQRFGRVPGTSGGFRRLQREPDPGFHKGLAGQPADGKDLRSEWTLRRFHRHAHPSDGTRRVEPPDRRLWNSFDVTRDPDTGLITQSRDPNGLATNYDYDALGRLTTISPPGGELPTKICYFAAITGNPAFTIVKKTNGDPCVKDDGTPATGSGAFEGYQYDGFGRSFREIRM